MEEEAAYDQLKALIIVLDVWNETKQFRSNARGNLKIGTALYLIDLFL